MAKNIKLNVNKDGVDRRGFLECMAWAGTGVLWTMEGGILRSKLLGQEVQGHMAMGSGFSFVQISDSHIGFNKDANKDVTATLQKAVAKLNALPQNPAFVLHTGDITQLAKPEEFDTANEVLKSVKTSRICYVPAEHDVAADNRA